MGGDAHEQRKILELVETILVYKLKQITREEIEAMFTLDELKETQYFQDVKREGFEQGIQRGIDQEKSLIIRQITRKIGTS